MPPTLVLPDHLVQDTKDYAGELEALAVLADEVKHWTAELKSINESLQLVWAPEGVTHPALSPGRFHIIEHRPLPTPPNVIPLEDPETGAYMEPGSWMFDMLARNDMWSSRNKKMREERDAKLRDARARAIEREKEDMATELDERIHSLINTSISMTGTKKPWTNRHGAATPKR